ncbi:MAG: hypothetical protein WCJ94_04305 [bacterium]
MAKNQNKEQQHVPVQKLNNEFSIKDYVYINIFFWAFLVIVALVVFFTTGAKMDPIMENVFVFIFAVFGCGFTVVSIFDGVYEKLNKGAQNEK